MSASTIHGRFAEQARRTPDAVAVSAGDVRLTYRELDERANGLARRLLDLGVTSEAPVAVLMERSPDLVVALLGILKSGGCYLPLHDAYPAERKQWVMDSSAAPVLLADEVMRDRGLPRSVTGNVVILGGTGEESPAGPDVEVDPDQLAYVIYTSGSTGHPKGVAVTHRDVLGLVDDQTWSGGRHDVVLMVAPYAFNVSTYELWVPLLHGGRIAVAPPGKLAVGGLRRLLEAEDVTGIHLTSGLFRVVADEVPESLAGVREVLTGGDVIAPTAVKRVLDACPGLSVRAMYGATEGTLFSTCAPMTAPYETGTIVPVGRPMDKVEIHVLDDRLSPVPPGVVGEVYIGGLGVARGYYRRPDLTAERFVPDPFASAPGGAQMYRTGDLARWNDDGLLEYVGRENDQVKILGFRVELAEVEAVLARHPRLAHVAVVARENRIGEKRLFAYVVPEGEIDVRALRGFALESLPDYMVPTAFVALEELPLTPNGKLDRRALPAPDFDSMSTYRPPENALQETLCALFAEVLDVPRVGIDDSFFDTGGQSLQAMRLVNRIHAVLGADVPISALFDSPTVAGLARRLESSEPAA